MIERETGLVLRKKKLLYGWKHGFGYRWLPLFVQDGIVTVWNWVACRLFGHDWFGPYPEDGIERGCMSCCKKG